MRTNLIYANTMGAVSSAPLPVIVAASLLSGCGSGQAETDAVSAPAVEVSVAAVESRPISKWDEFNGRISAIGAVELRPRVSGYVERIAYQEGSEVNQGDLMFVIDPRAYRAALDDALAQLERARATALLAQSLEQRAQSLIAANAISSNEFDTRRADSVRSVADVRAAEAAVATARLNLSFTEVRAPISGRASRAILTSGNLAVADETLLTLVVSQDPVYVDFAPDEHSYLSYQERMRKDNAAQAPDVVHVGLINEQGFPHLGHIVLVENEVDSVTGTIRMRAVVPNPNRLFTPGLFARVQLTGSSESEALVIDDKAVLTDQDHKYVYVLGPGDKALRRDVELGFSSGSLRVVEAGLAIGDKVVVDGHHRIFSPGMQLKATEVSMNGVAAAVTAAARAPKSAAK